MTNRVKWVCAGLALQALGTAIPLFVGYERGVHEGVGGNVTFTTVRLIWHQMVHDSRDLPAIALGVVLFVIGSVVIARPFCRRRSTWLIAVPLGALAGIVVLGALAALLTLSVLVFGGIDGGTPGQGSKAPKSERNEGDGVGADEPWRAERPGR